MSNVEYSTSTEGDTMTDTFLWTVPKFLDILNLSNKSKREILMEKPENAAADWSGSRFQLKMRFLGQDNNTIEICYFSPTRLILKSEFKIRNRRSGQSAYQERVLDTRVNYIDRGNQWQHLGALLKRDIVGDENSFLVNDNRDPNYGSLCLIIKFTIFQKKYDLYRKYFDKSNVTETQLSHDFAQLLTSEVFSDVTIKSVEGNEYKVHKNVLASRSAVLKAFLEHNTTECQTNIIKSHFEDEVLKKVLMFIYSNKAIVDEIPEKLLAAADFYQLSRLKSLCEKALSKKLTVENVIETLKLANLYSAENLIQSALDFIKENQASQIIESEGWAKLNVEKLVKNMFKLYIKADDN